MPKLVPRAMTLRAGMSLPGTDEFTDGPGCFDAESSATDQIDEALAANDQELATAMVTLKENRDKMNKIRMVRDFFKGRIDGSLSESTSSPSKGQGRKGRGYKGSESKSSSWLIQYLL